MGEGTPWPSAPTARVYTSRSLTYARRREAAKGWRPPPPRPRREGASAPAPVPASPTAPEEVEDAAMEVEKPTLPQGGDGSFYMEANTLLGVVGNR